MQLLFWHWFPCKHVLVTVHCVWFIALGFIPYCLVNKDEKKAGQKHFSGVQKVSECLWYGSQKSSVSSLNADTIVLSPLPLTFQFKSGCYCTERANIWLHDISMNARLIVKQLRWRRHSRVWRGCRSWSLNHTCGGERRWHIRVGAVIGCEHLCGWRGCQKTN